MTGDVVKRVKKLGTERDTIDGGKDVLGLLEVQ
jgi:hypothetical protein